MEMVTVACRCALRLCSIEVHSVQPKQVRSCVPQANESSRSYPGMGPKRTRPAGP